MFDSWVDRLFSAAMAILVMVMVVAVVYAVLFWITAKYSYEATYCLNGDCRPDSGVTNDEHCPAVTQFQIGVILVGKQTVPIFSGDYYLKPDTCKVHER